MCVVRLLVKISTVAVTAAQFFIWTCYYEHDMGETLERAPTSSPLFARLVICSTYGCLFARYYSAKRKLSGGLAIVARLCFMCKAF